MIATVPRGLLASMLVLSVVAAGMHNAWEALRLFGARDATLHWPAIGTFASGASGAPGASGATDVSGEDWHEPAVRAIGEHVRDGDHLIVLSDDANAWGWISYATYPRAWHYVTLTAAPFVFGRLPPRRAIVYAEWPRAPGVDALAVATALASRLESFAAQRTARVVWADVRGCALIEIAP